MLDTAIFLQELVEARRLEANNQLNPCTKAAQGQFLTSWPIAAWMASLFEKNDCEDVRVLDAGAGIGSLTAAFVTEFCTRRISTNHITAIAYETDPTLVPFLQATLTDCMHACEELNITFQPQIVQQDFIAEGADYLFMAAQTTPRFTHAILNPPYKKIHTSSDHRRLLRSIGVETVNLYTGFLAVAIKLLQPGGELVAIVPRSFCNGPYYRPFRELLLRETALRAVHVFGSRTDAFKDDAVLQENIIIHVVRGATQGPVTLSQSLGADVIHSTSRVVDFAQIVNPNDPERFMHLALNENDQYYIKQMRALPCTLADLGVDASTGPVVDFRLAPYLRGTPQPNTYPLIYPIHCRNHVVLWPLEGGKKPNAIVDAEPVRKWLYLNGHYTLIRRFSAKEERRRVVASVHDPRRVPGAYVGFENHLNVLHHNRQGLTPVLAQGLAVYLNSTLVDVCFRQFNGHTQVNVKDLYALRYPSRATLECWGSRVQNNAFPDQATIDAWIAQDIQ